MLARPHRAAREEVRATIQGGRPIQGVFLSIKYRGLGTGIPKAAIVVSAKVAKLAVGRNRIKRRLRAILTPILPQLRPGLIIVVFAKKEARAATFAELKDDLNDLLSRARIIVSNS